MAIESVSDREKTIIEFWIKCAAYIWVLQEAKPCIQCGQQRNLQQ